MRPRGAPALLPRVADPLQLLHPAAGGRPRHAVTPSRVPVRRATHPASRRARPVALREAARRKVGLGLSRAAEAGVGLEAEGPRLATV